MKENIKDLYNEFAPFYNKFWTKETPKLMQRALDILLFPNLKKTATILDLCSGTGQVANNISKIGYNIEGLDSSATMLAYAYVNAPDVKFYHDDAATFKLKKKYNAIISLFDSVNHFLSEELVLKVFKNVYGHLKSDGVFLFDINSERSSMNVSNNNFAIAEDRSAFILNAFYDNEKKLLNYLITIFKKDGGNWVRYDEKIIERYYETDKILLLLKTAGFKNVAVAKGFDDLKIPSFRERIFITAWR